jgi:hypothetical protein
MTTDPEHERWRRKHPRFPGVAKCVELLRRHNTTGSRVDIICGELEVHAAEHAAELLADFQAETNERLRRILLGIIAEAGLPEALPVLIDALHAGDDSLRHWAVQRLRNLGSADARRALWEAGLK